MGKKIGFVLLVIVLIVVAVILAKDIIARSALTAGVNAVTGLKLQIKGMKVGLITTLIDIEELKLFNPAGFKDKVMVDMPEIYIDYDLGAFFKRRVHLEEVRLNLKELLVVKNAQGELNLDSLKVVKEEKEEAKPAEKEKAAAPEVQIDNLHLKIAKIIYKDYTKDPVEVKEYDVNIDEQRKDIKDIKALTTWILYTALLKTPIANLTGFDLGQLQDKASQIMEEGKTMMEKTKETLKNLWPFGK